MILNYAKEHRLHFEYSYMHCSSYMCHPFHEMLLKLT